MSAYSRGSMWAGVLMLVVSSIQAQETDPLTAAYEKEAAYLDSEIALLKQRMEKVDAEGADRVQSARADLDSLEKRLLALSSTVDRRDDELRVVETERNDAVGASDTLDSIIRQSATRLAEFGVPAYAARAGGAASISEEQRTRQELRYAFDESLSLLERLGTVRTEEGEFFLEDGTLVSGRIVHLGRIASLGITENLGGTLAPAGAGMLRVVDSRSAGVARTLERGDAPQAIPIYLYESLDYLVNRTGPKSIGDIVDSGGIIGYVIVVLGGLAVVLIALRAFFLYRARGRDEAVLEEVIDHVQRGDFDAARRATEHPKGALTRVLASTVRCLAAEPKRINDVLAESTLNEQPALERFRSAITVFAAVAPLLGLLGTVTGMISTFDVITEYGTGDPKLLSGGISEALVTTELGLIVAIPALLIGNLLTGWSDRIASRLEVSALRVVNSRHDEIDNTPDQPADEEESWAR